MVGLNASYPINHQYCALWLWIESLNVDIYQWKITVPFKLKDEWNINVDNCASLEMSLTSLPVGEQQNVFFICITIAAKLHKAGPEDKNKTINASS